MLIELKNRIFAVMKRRMGSGAVASAENVKDGMGPAAVAFANNERRTGPAFYKEYG